MTITDLLALDPAGGVPTGHDDWLFAVDLATSQGLWGIGKWGTAKWSTWEWHALDPVVISAEWERGRQNVAAHMQAGVATLQLRIPKAGNYSPFAIDQAPYLDYGVLVRLAFTSATHGTVSQFVGRVESLVENPVEMDKWRYVTVTLVEPSYGDLAIYKTPPIGAVGAGDTVGARVARLLDAAQFKLPYPSVAASAPFTTVQATTMAADRLAEILLTCDSSEGFEFVQQKNGHVELVERSVPGEANVTLDGTAMLGERSASKTIGAEPCTVMPMAGAPIVALVDEAINQANYTRVGGSVQTVNGTPRRGPTRPDTRTDLICTTDGMALEAAGARVTLTASGMTCTAYTNTLNDPLLQELVIFSEIDRALPVWREFNMVPEADELILNGTLQRYKHTLTALTAARCQITSEYTTTVHSITAPAFTS